MSVPASPQAAELVVQIPERPAAPRTERGVRQVEAILEGALRSLATRGYAGSSLARIAEESGVSKRMILYYFEDREQLFVELLHRITSELIADSEAAMAASDDPGAGAVESARRLWQRVLSDSTLVRAYFAVLGESGTNPMLRELLAHVRDANREVITVQVARAERDGLRLALDVDTLSLLMFAGFRGLLLELYERGPSPQLDAAVALFEQAIVAAFAGVEP